MGLGDGGDSERGKPGVTLAELRLSAEEFCGRALRRRGWVK